MYKILLSLLTVFVMIALPDSTLAAPFKTYVSEFKVVGAPNKEELKTTLQDLLTSRLNPKQAKLVDKPENAEIEMIGSYAMFGKVFSIDLLIKNAQSGSLTKVFEQGESQDDLIPAFGRLAGKIDSELAGMLAAAKPAMAAVVSPVSPIPAAVALPVATATTKAEPVEQNSYVVKSEAPQRNTSGNWTSEPLNGVYKSIALGRTLPSGEREIFVAGDNSIQYFIKGADLVKVAEATIPASARIVSIDTADLDSDGMPELYASIIDRGAVATRVYTPVAKGLELTASELPWLMRGVGTGFTKRLIYTQAMTGEGNFYGQISTLVKNGKTFSVIKGFSLPKSGNLYNFSKIKDSKGKELFIAFDEDLYLNVYSMDGSRLWKSEDKFSGSENRLNFENSNKSKTRISNTRSVFIDQRITVLADNTIIIPKNNESLTSVGHNRSFNKHSIWGFQWGGSYLTEAWRTRLTATYLADYAFDADTNEFILLEVAQKDGMFNSGKTVISINKIK